MSNKIPEKITYFGIEFSKDMTVANDEVSFRNSIFTKYDTTPDRKFDDEEWECFVKSVENETNIICQNYKKRNANIEKKYRRKVKKLEKQFRALIKEYNKSHQNSYFKDLTEFIQNHETLYLYVVGDNEDVPEGTILYDISSFGIGYQEETGRCYQQGYLIGLETLSEPEQKYFLELLNSAIKETKQWQNIEETNIMLSDEIEKYTLLSNMAERGVLSETSTTFNDNEIYTKYNETIRSSNNPFWEQIQKLEAERNSLQHEFLITPDYTEDGRAKRELMQQKWVSLDRQIIQFFQASQQWFINNYNNIMSGDYTNVSITTNINPKDFKDESNLKYGTNLNIGHQGTNYSINANGNFETSYNYRNIYSSIALNTATGYEFNADFTDTSNIISINNATEEYEDESVQILSRNTQYNYSMGYSNTRWGFNISHLKSATDGNNFENTTVNVKKYLGNVEFNTSGEFNEMSTKLNAGITNKIKLQNKPQIELNLTQDINTNYDIKTNYVQINTNLSGNINYLINKHNLSGFLSVNDNFYYVKPADKSNYTYGNTLSVGNYINYKNYGANINFAHTVTSSQGDYNNINKSWAFGIGGSYNTSRTSLNLNISHTEGIEDAGTTITAGVKYKINHQ